MYLRTLRLWNFRKYGSSDGGFDLGKADLIVPFKNGLNVLIGENDSGKTAIIDAIKLVLRTHSGEWIGLDEDDFYSNSKRLRIECEFAGFKDEEAQHFSEWLSWEGQGDDAKPYLNIFIDAGRTEERILPFDIKAGLDEDGISINAEAREYLKVTYLKPLRDASAELVPRKNSRLSQILKAHPAFKKDPENHHLVKQFKRFNKAIEKYFEGKDSENNPLAPEEQLGKELKDEIDRYLGAFYQKVSEFDVAKGDLKQILERLELAFRNEKNLGLGSHNILFISTELLHLNKSAWTGLRLGLIEEVEAHLHPQIQLQIIESLQKQTSPQIQLIITTHSPNIGSKVDLENLIICSGNQVFPMGKGYTKLADTDYGYLERFLDVTKANLFFAKGVLLVEGWGEELILPALANKLGINLTQKGVSIVNIGNTAFLRYSGIFKRKNGPEIRLPVAVITDLDVEPSLEEDLYEGQPLREAKAAAKVSKYSGGPVRTFVSPHWTLEYCIGLSSKLREFLFLAVKKAGEEMTQDGYSGKTVEEDWQAFSTGKTPEVVAQDIYARFIGGGKKISKAIIAQHLAQDLDSLSSDQLTKEDLLGDGNIKYLLDAIKYASGDH